MIGCVRTGVAGLGDERARGGSVVSRPRPGSAPCASTGLLRTTSSTKPRAAAP